MGLERRGRGGYPGRRCADAGEVEGSVDELLETAREGGRKRGVDVRLEGEGVGGEDGVAEPKRLRWT